MSSNSLSTLQRLRCHGGYTWEQSTYRPLATAKTWVDTRAVFFCPSVVSGAGPHAPTIAYAGAGDGVSKIHQLLERRREELGAATKWRVGRRIPTAGLLSGHALPTADLVAVGCTTRQARRLPAASSLVLPFRLHLIVDVDGDPAELRRRTSRRAFQQFNADRKVRDWRFEHTTQVSAFDHFYDRMHVPTMEKRHGERARSESKDVAYECLFRHGVLFFVTTGGVRVAGALCHWDPKGRVLTMRLLGVLGGEQQHYDTGAFRALYHLLLEWSYRHDVRQVDFGGTEAWIAKGIFQWKRKFRPRVVLAPNHTGFKRVWWHAATDTTAVREFLVANPVLELMEPGELRSVYFYDNDRPPRFDYAYQCDNVKERRTVHLDSFLRASKGD